MQIVVLIFLDLWLVAKILDLLHLCKKKSNLNFNYVKRIFKEKFQI